MNDLSTGLLLGIIVFLIVISAFFSGSETGMLSLNRYRLKHLSKNHHKSAKRALKLLERPDKLIGVILLGNILVNNLAAAITTLLAIRLFNDDDSSIAIATLVLTILVLIFGEITPKTIAALYPERIAFPASLILKGLLALLYPLVWMMNHFTNGLIKIIGLDPNRKHSDQLSSSELRSIVDDAGNLIPDRHQSMLLNILDLESATVEDIMIPRGDMFSIDICDSEEEILRKIEQCEYTRVPVYENNIDDIIGILHMRNLGKLLSTNDFSKEALRSILREPIFSPEGTGLHMQLMNFQKDKRRIAIVIDEYGAVLGLATLEDILEEIVGEFTSNLAIDEDDFETLADGSFSMQGSTTIRDLNRQLSWKLPINGPKTLSGLVLEHLESFPDGNVSVKINDYVIEILDIKDNVIGRARVFKLTDE